MAEAAYAEAKIPGTSLPIRKFVGSNSSKDMNMTQVCINTEWRADPRRNGDKEGPAKRHAPAD